MRPLIMGALPRPLARYLAAGAAGDYFFDVWWRRGLTALFFNAFPVDRSGKNPRNVSAKMLLEHDVPVLVFPEGTRSKDGIPGHFKPGAAALVGVDGCADPADRHHRGARIASARIEVAEAGPPAGRRRVRVADDARGRARTRPSSWRACATRSCAMHDQHSARILDRQSPEHSDGKEKK